MYFIHINVGSGQTPYLCRQKTDMDGFDSKRLDDVLGMFSGVNGGRIPAGLLLNHEETPEDWSRAIEFLTEEGYLK
ncbi:MAG: hypothetical protein IAA73_04460 [Bacteroidetes bacterium]|uniref:Uncharacterized protein n=1 Tax=Candidatus Gallipaludibacter merdavium TaxID=2840839 RepID=A0A9D9HTA4_9BACT|nr:hypothetical protein [Candidatus Gallipaludibacter merdavium]